MDIDFRRVTKAMKYHATKVKLDPTEEVHSPQKELKIDSASG